MTLMDDEQFLIVRRDFLTLSRNIQSISESLIVFTGIFESISESLYNISEKDKEGKIDENKIKSRKKN